jgi:ribosomal RNA-processing protein 9
MKPLKTFTSHRDSVTSLSFSPQPPSSIRNPQNTTQTQLFTSSLDRTLKTYSLPPAKTTNPASQIAYVETLFGHQDTIPSVAAMSTDFCVSVGARDRTARYWKVVDETQLVFRGGGPASRDSPFHEGSIDVVATIPPHHFVTGGDAGTISLWSIHKKKPLHSIAVAHGLDDRVDTASEEDRKPRFAGGSPRWITALATLKGTDVVVSGSWDGFVRMWKVSEDKRKLEPIGIVGNVADDDENLASTNGRRNDNEEGRMETVTADAGTKEPKHLVRGVVNDLAIFERFQPPAPPAPSPSNGASKSKRRGASKVVNGDLNGEVPPKKSKSIGITIIAAVGKEHRLGRWKKYQGQGAKNGAVMLEIDFKEKADGGDGDDEDGGSRVP